MTQHVNSRHSRTRLHKPKDITLAHLTEKQIRLNKRRHAARPSKAIKLKSSAMLVARSEELLKGLLEKYGTTPSKHDIFKGLLKATSSGTCDASIGRKLWRLRRLCIMSSLASPISVSNVIAYGRLDLILSRATQIVIRLSRGNLHAPPIQIDSLLALPRIL